MSRKNRRASRNDVWKNDASERFSRTESNVYAILQGPQQKRWTKHDIKQIQPLTQHQRDMFECYYQGSNVIGFGSPGTGKTFLALYLSLSDIVDPSIPQDKIKIVRSAVPSRQIGHLPGTVEEKMAVYEMPYVDACAELLGKASSYEDLKKAQKIDFVTTSFVRGSSWDNTIVIIDEAQNMTWQELNSVITRIGYNSRLIITGDTKQCDFSSKHETTGFVDVIKVAKIMDHFSLVQFDSADIVRSEFVKSWIIACEKNNL
jgi:phosphate starvation-inducible protein PhoH